MRRAPTRTRPPCRRGPGRPWRLSTVTTPPSSPGRHGRLGALDALRFIAAAAVVAFHFTARQSPAWEGPAPEAFDAVGPLTSYGRLGVALFFVISGFVILMSSWGRDLPHFVASRVGRL